MYRHKIQLILVAKLVIETTDTCVTEKKKKTIKTSPFGKTLTVKSNFWLNSAHGREANKRNSVNGQLDPDQWWSRNKTHKQFARTVNSKCRPENEIDTPRGRSYT